MRVPDRGLACPAVVTEGGVADRAEIPRGDEEGLKAGAMAGGRWSATSSIGRQLVTTLATVVLARLLAPADYGIAVAVTVILGVFELMSQFGIGQSLVRHRRLDPSTTSTTFWASLIIAGVVSTSVVVFADPLGSLIGQEGLGPFLRLAAVGLAVSMAASVPAGLLTRQMAWSKLTMIQLAGSIVQFSVAVGLAATTALGAWVLIIGRVAGSAFQFVGLFWAARWTPTWEFSPAVVRRDLSFNLGFWSTYVTSYVAKNLDYWVVGRLLGAAVLGVYYIAYVLPVLVRQRITRVLEGVLYPVMARVADDRRRLEAVYVEALGFSTFVTLPAVLGLVAIADLVVPLFFGTQWSGAVAPMRILAVATAFDALLPVGTALFLALGLPGRNAVITTSRVVAMVVVLAVVAGSRDLTSIAWAVAAGSVTAVVVAFRLVVRRAGVSPRSFASAVLAPSVTSAAMLGVVVATRQFTFVGGLGDLPQLVVAVVVGIVAYTVLGMGLFRRRYRKYFADLATLVGFDRIRQRTSTR